MIVVTEIPKPADCRYMTLAETMLSNSDRHWQNAQRYLGEGKPDYAFGSLRKAARNEDRARGLAP